MDKEIPPHPALCSIGSPFKKNWLLAGLGIAFMLTLIAGSLSRRRTGSEVLFDSRPVAAWALDLDNPVVDTREKAKETIQRFDSTEVPPLVHLLRTPDPILGKAARTSGRYLPHRVRAALFRMMNPFEAPQKRACAAQALKMMGPKSREALPALRKALQDDTTVSWFAALTLAGFGEEGINVLTQSLSRIRRPQSEYVCYALSTPGAAASNAVPTLAAVLDKGYPQVAEKAASALGCIGQAAVPRLMQSLRHGDLQVRILAARSLGSMGALARNAFPQLSAMARDDEPAGRQAAIEALAQVRPGAEPTVRVLSRAAKDSNRDVRLKAVRGLRGSSPRSASAIGALLDALNDPSADVRVEAAELLGEMDDTTPAIIPALRQRLEDEVASVRERARQSLEKLSKASRR